VTSSTIRESLQRIQFLQNVTPELIDELAGISSLVEFSSDAIIFRQGDVASSIYLILEGRVSLELCAAGIGCRRILTVGSGDLLGWSPVLQQSLFTATARALVSTQAIQVDGIRLQALGEANPRLGYEFMKRAAMALAKRLTATRMQLVDVYGAQMPQIPDERKPPQSVSSQ
jgi:CRP-like cAMP-binding protein